MSASTRAARGAPRTPLPQRSQRQHLQSHHRHINHLGTENDDARFDNSDGLSASFKSDSAPPPSSSSSPPPNGGSGGQNPPASPPPADTPTSPGSITKQPVPKIYPQVLALLIARRPLFPRFYKAVAIRNPKVFAAIKEMKHGQSSRGVFLLKDENKGSDVITDINLVRPVGIFSQITSVFAATGRDNDREEDLTAALYLHRRIKITDLVKAGGLAKVQEEDPHAVIPPPSPSLRPSDQQTTGDYGLRLLSSFANTIQGPVQTSSPHKHVISIVKVENLVTQPYNKNDQYICTFMSEIVSVFKDTAQLNPPLRDQIAKFSINQVASNVFDEPNKLADFAAAVLTGEKELINAQLQSRLSRDADSKIAKRQRGYYLMEQLKGVKKELRVQSDGKDKLIEKFKERAATLKMPEPVRKAFDEEISKLAALEADVTRSYLEWLTQIPWGQHTLENYSITNAQTVLDEDHCGLKGVKDRILKFPRYWEDHSGAQGVGTENPLVLIDEVEKIDRGHNGSPATALLEMLDPEQNNSFLYRYMDVPVDLSRVLFVSNNLDTILAPLLDRMEVLEVSGYVSEEKVVITDKYLGPQAKEASGLKEADIVLEPSAIDVLIKYYCRESGVRNLKKHIDKATALELVQELGEEAFPEPTLVATSAADTKTVESQEPPSNEAPASTPTPADPDAPSPATLAEKPTEQTLVTTQKRNPMPIPDSAHVRITPDTLKDYVGPPIYQKDRMYVSPPPPGVSTSLGYLGNSSGVVMPEGSIGKTGPSAGTAILSAFVSL
ncbi:hypothetical protein BD779DRAFT_1678625 [Infundibulicybe gibba]|nr:hypothetical protein BD779DRAFT_1678625 [Infundibulicybe gibba]